MAHAPIKYLEQWLARGCAPLGGIQDHTLWQAPGAAHTRHVFVAHDNLDCRAQDPHFVEKIPGVRGHLTADRWDPSLTSPALLFLHLIRGGLTWMAR